MGGRSGKVRVTVYMSEVVYEKLRRFVERELSGRRGALSAVVEWAVDVFIDEYEESRKAAGVESRGA